MSSTLAQLRAEVSQALRDPSNKTFTAADVNDIVNAALAEISRICPEQYQEDITPVPNSREYTLCASQYGGEARAEVEVARVEVWDGSVTPATRLAVVRPASDGYAVDSEAGWSVWGGKLYMPLWVPVATAGREDDYLIRTWGYRPYQTLTSDSDAAPISPEMKWALVAYTQVEALRRLLNERDLFTQWQTRAGNTDISPAGLMNSLNLAMNDWRRRSRELTRLRAAI